MGRRPMSMVWKISIAKMAAFHILIYGSEANSITVLLSPCRDELNDSKIHVQLQGNQNSQNNLEITKLKDSHLSILKPTTKLQQSRHCGTCIRKDSDQRCKIEGPEVNPYIYGQLVVDKGAKTGYIIFLLLLHPIATKQVA